MNLVFLQALANQRARFEAFLTARLQASRDGIIPMGADKFERYVEAYDHNFDELTRIVTLIRDRVRALH